MATKKSREICIIGLGRFGSAIADQLLKDKKNKIKLVLIDKDEKHLIPFKDEVNAIYVADAAERNIEITAALSEVGAKKIIARANSKRHANVLKQIGVNIIISPEEEAGQRAALLVANPSFTLYSQMVVELQDGYVTGSTYIKNPALIGKMIKDLRFREQHEVLIVIVKRGTRSFLPAGTFTLQKDDLITIVGATDDVIDIFDLCASEKEKK